MKKVTIEIYELCEVARKTLPERSVGFSFQNEEWWSVSGNDTLKLPRHYYTHVAILPDPRTLNDEPHEQPATAAEPTRDERPPTLAQVARNAEWMAWAKTYLMVRYTGTTHDAVDVAKECIAFADAMTRGSK